MGRYLLQNIHDQFPEAKLGLVVAGRGDMIRDLFASSPWITVIEANRRNLPSLIRLWKEFHSSDLTVTQYTGKVGSRFGLASKIAARLLTRKGRLIGFNDAFAHNGFIYDKLLPFRADAPVVEHEREALRVAGLSVVVPYPTLPLEHHAETLAKFSVLKGTYLVLHFFAGNKGRSMRPEKANELLSLLRTMYGDNITFLVSGAPADRDTAVHIAESIPNTRVIAGGASLQEMMQLVSSSMGVISVDTGIAHITAHLSRPLVVLRSCLGPNWWFSEAYGPARSIAQHTREDLCVPHVFRDYPVCLDDIDLSKVKESASLLFSRPT